MKTIVKILLAAVLVVTAGIWVTNSLGTLNKQAEALEKEALLLNNTQEVSPVNIEEQKPTEERKTVETEVKGVTQLSDVVAVVEPVEPIVSEEEIKTPFDESIVRETASKFSAPLYMANENGKIEGYVNREHLIHVYYMPFVDEMMTREFAHFFFYDQIDGLYLVDTHYPILLEAERDFTITQVNEDQYQVTQEIQKETPEDASFIMVEYIYDEIDNDWNILNIDYAY